jgi:cytochrome P450
MEAAGIGYTGLAITLILVSVAYLVVSPIIDGWGKPPLPPGPPALPIIGNVHQMSLSAPWKQHMEWTKKYGPIFRLKAGKDTIIVLGTMQAARDLLDKKSKIYSSRPRSVMAFENVSKGLRPVLMPDNEQWKTARRLQGVVLTYKMSQSYRGVQALESLQLLRGLLQNKSKFQKEFHRFVTPCLNVLYS